MDIIERLKKNEKPFGLLDKELRDGMWAIADKDLRLYTGGKWQQVRSFSCGSDNVYRLRPDYQPELENELVGQGVTVFDRYRFAVPVRGFITDVSSKDGAYKVEFYADNPGRQNVTRWSGTYFHRQQCRLDTKPPVAEPEPEPEIVECEIKCHSGALVYTDIDKPWVSLNWAINEPNFIGFKFEDGKIFPFSVRYLGAGSQICTEKNEDNEVLHATHVLFRKDK